MCTKTFVGETQGTLSSSPRGKRGFYWDVIFCPNGQRDKTYAEIADEADGLNKKLKISQSSKALSAFATYLSAQNGDGLFDLS
jgi:XTP/dITP diphosphohydrolase